MGSPSKGRRVPEGRNRLCGLGLCDHCPVSFHVQSPRTKDQAGAWGKLTLAKHNRLCQSFGGRVTMGAMQWRKRATEPSTG